MSEPSFLSALAEFLLEFFVHLVHKGEYLRDRLIQFHRDFFAYGDFGENLHQIGILLNMDACFPCRGYDLLGDNSFAAGHDSRGRRLFFIVDDGNRLVDNFFSPPSQTFVSSIDLPSGTRLRMRSLIGSGGIPGKSQTDQRGIGYRGFQLVAEAGEKIGLFLAVRSESDK